MLYVNFVGDDVPYTLAKSFVLDANNIDECVQILKRYFSEVRFLFIDSLDDTSKYDTILTLDGINYYAFSRRVKVYTNKEN